MKEAIILSVLVVFLSCRQEAKDERNIFHSDSGCEHEQELAKVRDTFDLKLLELYNSKLPYQEVIVKADSLVNDLRQSPSPLMSEISNFCIQDIHYFKGELFYRNCKYAESIEELKKSTGYDFLGPDEALGVAANFLKLKDNEKARAFIDSTHKSYYLYDLSLGNYYETLGDEKEAIKIYQGIVNESHTHRFYYRFAVSRLQELKKDKPTYLNELIFPTRKPGAETLTLK